MLQLLPPLLRNTTSSRYSIVSSNNIANLGAASLTQALERSGNLCEFNNSYNGVQSEWERHLFEALEHCVDINPFTVFFFFNLFFSICDQ